MTEQQLSEIEQRWAGLPKLHCDGWSVVDDCGNIITTGSHWGNNFATIVIKNYAQLFAESPDVVRALLAEVRRLNRMVDKACQIIAENPDCAIDKTGVRQYLESEVADE